MLNWRWGVVALVSASAAGAVVGAFTAGAVDWFDVARRPRPNPRRLPGVLEGALAGAVGAMLEAVADTFAVAGSGEDSGCLVGAIPAA